MKKHTSQTKANRIVAFTAFAGATSRNARKAALLLFSVAVLLAGGAAARGQSALDGFDPNANGAVRVAVVQPDGKILIGGEFTTVLGLARNYIARLNADGKLDTAFDPNANNFVLSLAVQPDGRVLAGGTFTTIGGQTRNSIARLNATTGLADSWDPNANGFVQGIAVQVDGKILAGVAFTTIGGQTRSRIARLGAVTGLADSFNPNADNVLRLVMVQADGKILAGGDFTNIGGQTRNNIARLDAVTGSADSFDPNANGSVRAIAVQADGKILAGGQFNGANSIGGQMRNYIARLETDGRLDQTLNLGILGDQVNTIAIQADGKILIGGIFNTVLGVARNNIARLNADGTLDMSFDPNANGNIYSIALQTDGQILVGGTFFGANSIGGAARNNIARLDAATGLADSWNPIASARVYTFAVQTDGKILAGGQFTNIGGQPRNRTARLDATTGLADSWDPNCDGDVCSIVVQSNSKILVGGRLSNIGGQPRSGIGRLDATTGLADAFDPNALLGTGGIYSIALQADGKVIVVCPTGVIGGQIRNHIARLDAVTGAPDSFDPNANSFVYSIAVQGDGKILAGGAFQGANSIGGQPCDFFARLSNDTAALQNIAATPTTVTWTRGGSSRNSHA